MIIRAVLVDRRIPCYEGKYDLQVDITASVHFGLRTVYISNRNIDFGRELFEMFTCLATWILVEKIIFIKEFSGV